MSGELILLSQCLLRPLRPDDAPSLSKHGNNRNVWIQTAGIPYPLTPESCEQWIRQRLESKLLTILAIEIDHEAVGCFGLMLLPEPKSHSAEIGYWLGESYWNRGIVTEAVNAVTTYAFVHLNLLRIQAHVYEGNPASMRVLEKCGYQREGWLRKSVRKDGRILDQALYAIVRDL